MIDKMQTKMWLRKAFLEDLEQYRLACIEAGYETKEEIAEAMFNHMNLVYPIPIKKSVITLFLDWAYEALEDRR